jgi:hypothetical protein
VASSTPTIIDKPDGVSNVTAAGQITVAGGTLGVIVRAPGGPSLVWSEGDIQGASAAVQIEQNGLIQSYGGNETTLFARAEIVRGVFTSLSSAGQVLPAPDFTINSSTGATSYPRVSCSVDGLDWVGGFAAPKLPGGSSPFGAKIRAINNSGGGQTINVLDPLVGGAMRGPGPSVLWGFNEIIEWTWDNFGWCFTGKGAGYYFGGGPDAIGRLCKTSSTAAKKLLFWVKGSGATWGLGVNCDVVVSDPAGTAEATYFDVRFAYDTANVLYASSTATAPLVGDFCANAAAVALGFTGGELTLADDGSNHNLVGTAPTATPLTWKVINVRQSTGSSV